jgi:hypothetical protein
MKVTGFLVSKKLAEIGFNKETNFYYRKTDRELFINTPPDLKNSEEFFTKSYDLEILLDVLPKKMTNKYGKEFTLEISFDVSNWIYYIDKNDYIFLSENYIHGQMESEKNESLADTVGRFIILLHEKNLIKFKNI